METLCNIEENGPLAIMGGGQNPQEESCTKAPRPVKLKFLECGGRIPARMEPNEIYRQGGEANVPALSQSTPTNRGLANVTSVGPSSLVRGTSSTEPSCVALCTVRSRSMRQQELDEVYQLNKRKELDEKWASFFTMRMYLSMWVDTLPL